MYSPNFKAFLLLFMIGIGLTCFKICSEANNHVANRNQTNTYVVKLALFGDVGFGDRFEHNEEKILEYWKVVMYDVHLRFQTLSNLNISFQVTSLTTFKTPEEQQLFVESQDEYGEKLASKFHKKFAAMPNYDIAILLRGTPPLRNVIAEAVEYFKPNSICSKFGTVLVLLLNPQLAQTLAESVAQILGAPPNANISDIDPQSRCCMLEDSSLKTFAPCFFGDSIDKLLATKLSTHAASNRNCLNKALADKNPLIDSYQLFRNPSHLRSYTLQEQCKVLSNNSYVYGAEKFTVCLNVVCGSPYDSDAISIVPLEGSKCGRSNKGRCLRGVCIEPTTYLRNAATNKCLVPENSQFASDDKPVLRDCSKIPMDYLVNAAMDGNYNNFQPKMLYSTSLGAKMKVLAVEENSKLRFDANMNNSESFWSIMEINWNFNVIQPNREFLLKHKTTGYCAKVAEDRINVVLTKNCSISDKGARWNFFRAGSQAYVKPQSLFSHELPDGYFISL